MNFEDSAFDLFTALHLAIRIASFLVAVLNLWVVAIMLKNTVQLSKFGHEILLDLRIEQINENPGEKKTFWRHVIRGVKKVLRKL